MTRDEALEALCSECYAEPGEWCSDPIDVGRTWDDGTPRLMWVDRDELHAERGVMMLTLSQEAFDLLFDDVVKELQ